MGVDLWGRGMGEAWVGGTAGEAGDGVRWREVETEGGDEGRRREAETRGRRAICWLSAG